MKLKNIPKSYCPQNKLPQQNSDSESSFGQRLADKMTAQIGSWAFLTAQSGVLVVWIVLNSIPGAPHWDRNPFILLNLVFSFASAYTAPIVLMSQNRQSEEARKLAEADTKVNTKAGQDIELLLTKMDVLQEELATQQQTLEETQRKEIEMSVLLPLLNNPQASNFSKTSLPNSQGNKPEDKTRFDDLFPRF